MKLNHSLAFSDTFSLPWEAMGAESVPLGPKHSTDQGESLLRAPAALSYGSDSQRALQNQCHKVLQQLEASLSAVGYGPQAQGVIEQSLVEHCLKHPLNGPPKHVFLAKDKGSLAVIHSDGTLSDIRIDGLHTNATPVSQEISLAVPTCTLPGRWVYDDAKASGDATVLPEWHEPKRVDCLGVDAYNESNKFESQAQVFGVTVPGSVTAPAPLAETSWNHKRTADLASQQTPDVTVGLVVPQQPSQAVEIDDAAVAQAYPVYDPAQEVSTRQEILSEPQPLAPRQELSLQIPNTLDALDALARHKYDQAMQLAVQTADNPSAGSAETIESLLEQSALINQVVHQERQKPFSVQPGFVEGAVGWNAAVALQSLASQKYEEALALAAADTNASPSNSEGVASLMEQSYLLRVAAGQSSDSGEFGAQDALVSPNRLEQEQSEGAQHIQTTRPAKPKVVTSPSTLQKKPKLDSEKITVVSSSYAIPPANIKKRNSDNGEQALLDAAAGKKFVSFGPNESHWFCTKPYPVAMVRADEFNLSINPLKALSPGSDPFAAVNHISIGTGSSLAGGYVGITCGYGNSKPTYAIRDVFSFGAKDSKEKAKEMVKYGNLISNPKIKELLSEVGTTTDVIFASSLTGDGTSVTVMYGAEKKFAGSSVFGKYPYGKISLPPETKLKLNNMDGELQTRNFIVNKTVGALSVASDLPLPHNVVRKVAVKGITKFSMPEFAKMQYKSFNATGSYVPNGIRPQSAHVFTP